MTEALSRADLSLNRRQVVDSQKWYWFDQIGWYPHRYQILAHQCVARNRYTCAGRRGGKTAWAAKEAGAYMIAGPYAVQLVGPTYDDTYKEFRDIRDDMRHPANPHTIIRLLDNKQSGDLYITLSNGAILEGRSAREPKKSPIIGDEFDLMILCEGAKIKGLGGDGGLWETQLVGNLDSRLGDLIIPTTPAGKDNFLYPRFMAGLSRENEDDWSLQWPSYANPAYLEDPVEKRKRMSARSFREQVLGEFVSWSGAIWLEDCGFEPEKHVIAPFRIPTWWNRTEVIDPGFSGWFAWIAAVKDDEGRIFGVQEFRAKRERYKDLAHAIIQQRKFMYGDEYKEVGNRTRVLVDPEDPRCIAAISAEAREAGESIRCMKADNSVFQGFEAASTYFMTDSCFLFSTMQNSIDALSNHEWDESLDSNGNHREKRDEWKHFSDVWRYLLLKPSRSSTRPNKPVNPNTWTYKDLYDSLKPQTHLFGSDFDTFKRYHEGV